MKSLSKLLIYFLFVLLFSTSLSRASGVLEINARSSDKFQIEFGQIFELTFSIPKNNTSDLFALLEIHSKIENSFFIKSLNCQEETLELNSCDLTLIYLKHPGKQELSVIKEDKTIVLKIASETFQFLKPGTPPEGLRPSFVIKDEVSFGFNNWFKIIILLTLIGLIFLLRFFLVKRRLKIRNKKIKDLLALEIKQALSSHNRSQIEMLQKSAVKWKDHFSSNFGDSFIEELNKHQFKKQWTNLEFELVNHQLAKLVESIESGI